MEYILHLSYDIKHLTVISEVMHSFDRNMGTHRGISPTEDLESINKYLKYFVLFFSLMEVFFKYIMI